MVDVPTFCFDTDEKVRHALKLIQDEPLVQKHCLYRDLSSLMFNWWLQGKASATREKPDVIYERYSLFGNAGLYISQELGVPFMLEVNAPLRAEQEGHHAFTLTRTAEAIERQVLRSADTVIAVSGWLSEWMVKEGLRSQGIHVIPNGISEAVFGRPRSGEAVRTRLNLTGKRVIGYIGSFQQWHDIGGLVTAFKELLNSDEEVRLLLVGHGEMRTAVESPLIAEGLAQKAVFAGHVPYEDVPEYISAMDVPAVPYGHISDFYFSPIKLFECMASGRPTLAASIGQIQEIVEHGKTGWLYRPGDSRDLLQGIRTLLYDSELSSAIGAAGRAKILTSHTWRNVAGQIVGLARELLDRR
jgi:glycosyltransferase involved in cell wall biosynthesis